QNGIVGYSSTGAGNNGVLATYTMGGLVVRAGYQTKGNTSASNHESSLSVAYKAGALSFELGGLHQNGANGGSEETAVVEYALGNSNIGLAYGHNSDTIDMAAGANPYGNIVTLYGNTKFGATTVQAFVSHSSKLAIATGTKTTYGVGASYDLGSGAAVVGSVRQQYSKKMYADLGVKFSF
ncbi:porin, partial [Solirhodobacter olei]|uniref:porin n=1 Tax=Solirhodobacter olei TaxID=2493082 RepID=UPI000FD79254